MLNIYIGNLPFGTTEQELNDLFSPFGKVAKVAIIMDRETGRPRGFSFVEMPDDAQGHKAIEQLNSQEFNGRVLTVNEARPRAPRGAARARRAWRAARPRWPPWAAWRTRRSA